MSDKCAIKLSERFVNFTTIGVDYSAVPYSCMPSSRFVWLAMMCARAPLHCLGSNNRFDFVGRLRCCKSFHHQFIFLIIKPLKKKKRIKIDFGFNIFVYHWCPLKVKVFLGNINADVLGYVLSNDCNSCGKHGNTISLLTGGTTKNSSASYNNIQSTEFFNNLMHWEKNMNWILKYVVFWKVFQWVFPVIKKYCFFFLKKNYFWLATNWFQFLFRQFNWDFRYFIVV